MSFRLGRAVGAGRAGAVAGTALWLLSGPLQSAVNLWHHFAGACWMPWLVLAVDRAARLARGADGGPPPGPRALSRRSRGRPTRA
ncbi:MAG: hypothetical protein M0C28_28055 [Candidatus Moduliflexus flocculans]|nr:hypothetical protein [Candidatus Moduliflexus flocculans]